MRSRALITLGSSISRIADQHFATLRLRHRAGGLAIIGTRSGASSIVGKLPELRQYEVVVAVGFAGALAHEIQVGDIIIPTSACDYVTNDGRVQHADLELSCRLAEACGRVARVHTGRVGTVRTVVRRGDPHATAMLNQGLLGVEMELAWLFGHLRHDGRWVGAILVCSDHVFQAPLPDATADIRDGLPLTPRVMATTTLSLDLAIEFLIGFGKCGAASVSGTANGLLR